MTVKQQDEVLMTKKCFEYLYESEKKNNYGKNSINSDMNGLTPRSNHKVENHPNYKIMRYDEESMNFYEDGTV